MHVFELWEMQQLFARRPHGLMDSGASNISNLIEVNSPFMNLLRPHKQ